MVGERDATEVFSVLISAEVAKRFLAVLRESPQVKWAYIEDKVTCQVITVYGPVA